jgi:membrane-associated protease RseP (regulator of RpoE activity)
MGWLSQNGVYILAFAAIIGIIYHYLGVDGLVKCAIVAAGLCCVVFIHELGHFLAAKWCDVHVLTFSLGFGPAIPGCSFRRGETLYKIAILPLGGYVAMVGEGAEADENEDYPRSFKNKTVGQRMLIISAGVVMNMILGCLCFVGVFYFPGATKTKAIVSSVEPASPAWVNEVRSGYKIARIGNRANPTFENLKMWVASTWFHSTIHFEFEPPPDAGPPFSVDLEPRRTENDVLPIIGVGPPMRLQLVGSRFAKIVDQPVFPGTPATRARVIDLSPGQVVLRASAADSTDKLQPGEDGIVSWDALCRYMGNHRDKVITLDVATRLGPGNLHRSVTLSTDGFHFGDRFIATTDDAQSGANYDPFLVKPLRPDPFDDTHENCDPFEFHARMKRLAGRPVVIQVRREGQGADSSPVSILVPPVYTATTGMVMEMGRVAGTRNNSPAARAGIQEGDKITRVELLGTLSDSSLEAIRAADPVAAAVLANAKPPYVCADFNESDPARLPFDLEQAARRMTGPKLARFTVVPAKANSTEEDSHRLGKPVVLQPVEWDERWDDSIETPSKPASPMSIPQLGVAYWINCTVKSVQPGSPAAQAGILPEDRIAEVRWQEPDKPGSEEKKTWSPWIKLQAYRENGQIGYDTWAWCSYVLRYGGYPAMQVKVVRNGKIVQEGDKDKEFELKPVEDPTWPSDSLGFRFQADTTIIKAKSLLDALDLGAAETWDWVLHIYLGMRNLITGRIDPLQGFGGPISIATMAFGLASDPVEFILFMGIISINLAVVNFLPIPLLDGGHMVLLIYEKIRGKPPSDTWRAILTYTGAVIVLGLMILAFGVDIAKWLHWL